MNKISSAPVVFCLPADGYPFSPGPPDSKEQNGVSQAIQGRPQSPKAHGRARRRLLLGGFYHDSDGPY